ncbi:MFS general substrate transporter [Lepidopterella palustris CBS 459.81]|uniref:MFS general substrate transporter n=1 Tax=Lepidopterella palustris CBS 459.81 TaxID=1314670 RepID=A0A8E2JIA5_9PEZI|nr:MFS general substrate transporter [Lepidopterella palustris CBS 459.81]
MEQHQEDVLTALNIDPASALPEDSSEECRPPNNAPSAHAESAPYCTLPEHVKVAVILTASFASIISPFSTSIYYPAVTALSKDLGVSVSLINLTISTYQIFQGIAPSVTAAFSETYGRRPAYMLCFVVYSGANLGLALQNEYAALLVLRCVQSSGSSGTQALGSAIVADMATRAERGKYTAYATIGSTLGPAMGPVIGGLLSHFLGWRAIFWFLLILCGVLALLMVAVFPETSRSIVGNGSVKPPKWNRSLYQAVRNDSAPEDVHTLQKRKRSINPFTALCLLGNKENFILAAYTGILYAGYAAVSSILASQLARRYGLNEVQSGLCYIPLGSGALTSRWTMSLWIDWNFKREAAKQGFSITKNKQQDISQFNIEVARLALSIYVILGCCCCIVAYGWVMEYQAPLAAVLVVLFFTGNILTSSMIPMATLLLDINAHSPASASAAVNLVRMLLSAGLIAVYTPLINAIGIGWTSTMTAGIYVAFAPCLWIVYRHGHHWRMEEEKKQKNDRENNSSKRES